MNPIVFALDEAAALTFDATWLDSLFTVAEKCMGLLAKFPMNLYLAGAVAGIGFALFRKARRSAG